jgi:hypothetical protein
MVSFLYLGGISRTDRKTKVVDRKGKLQDRILKASFKGRDFEMRGNLKRIEI